MGVSSTTLSPLAQSMRFPQLHVRTKESRVETLPSTDQSAGRKVSLVCLAFRASGQPMVESWSRPFAQSFQKQNVSVYEVCWPIGQSFPSLSVHGE